MMRLFAIALMLLVAYMQAGFLALHPLRITIAKREAQEEMHKAPNDRLVRLAFHKTTSIHFKDEGKEIYLNGQMYDILRKEQSADSLIFHCYHDVEESRIMALFEKGLEGLFEEESAPNEGQHEVKVEIKFEYLATRGIPLLSIQAKTQILSGNNKLTSATLDLPSPPPKIS